ncbi:MAG: hypothetical protein ACI4IQ_03145 [Eubacterium sp.]
MKKSLSLILALFLICGLFSSCSSNQNEEETDTADTRELIITTDYHYSDMDESAVRAYEKLVEAVLNYESEVKFNTALTDSVNQLFYTCPFYALVDGISYTQDNTGVELKFKNDEQTHKQLINDFKEKINDIMVTCGYGTVNNNIYILNVYSYIAQNVNIDNTYTTVFDTVMYSKGVNSAISSMFEYLLLQASIPACHVMNLNNNGIAKLLSMVKFEGQWYYFDPASEIEKTSGKGLVYFAMDDSRAAVDSDSRQFVYTDQTPVDKIDDKAYSKLKDSQSYTLDGAKVTVQLKGQEDYSFECN